MRTLRYRSTQSVSFPVQTGPRQSRIVGPRAEVAFTEAEVTYGGVLAAAREGKLRFMCAEGAEDSPSVIEPPLPPTNSTLPLLRAAEAHQTFRAEPPLAKDSSADTAVPPSIEG